MVLADTSVWVNHLRHADPVMIDLFQDDQIVVHPFVIGELALGNLQQRRTLLNDLRDLRPISVADTEEVMVLIERNALFGAGIGWVDVNLLASTLAEGRARLWTRDRRLLHVAQRFQVAFTGVN